MDFKTPLLPGVLIRRYKRFLADIQLDSGEVITAHCPNSGKMLGVTDQGLRVWVEHTPAPHRRLAYTWHMVEVDQVHVGVNTWLPQILVREALARGVLSPFKTYTTIREEVAYGHRSRIDFLLSAPSYQSCYLEIKNVHLKRDDVACFPDTPTERGVKHMHELAQQVRLGHRSVVVYVVQRVDCTSFQIASDIDPMYAEAARAASAQGVEFLCYACDVSPESVVLRADLPLTIV